MMRWQDAFWSHAMDNINGLKDGTKLVKVCKQSAESFLALESLQSILIVVSRNTNVCRPFFLE